MAISRARTKKYKDKVYHYTLSEQAAENDRQAHLRWQAEHYERLYIYAPAGMKDELKALAERRGTSLRALVIGALEKELENDKKQQP